MTSAVTTGVRPFALVVYATTASLGGIVAGTAAAGLRDSMPLALIAGAVASAVSVWWLRRQPEAANGFADVPGWARRLFIAGAVLLLVQLVPLTAFIIDPNVGIWSADPMRPWQSRHSCVSCYWVAAEKATTEPDLYAETLYRPLVQPNVPRTPNLGPFLVDVFEYPPSFLPLPRLLALATPDFWGFRRFWFALNLAGVVVGLVLIARRVDASLGTFTVWLTPWVLLGPSVVGTLQVGNVQLLFLVQSAIAMLLFERRRHVLGGALLGYAIVSKLYPGVLILYLLLRRDWRAVGWTAAAGVTLTIIAIADVGWTPFAAFLDHLPKILSGEAFPGLRQPAPIAVNESIPGVVFKLGLFGVPNMGFAAARIVGWIYTGVLVAAIVWFVRRQSDPKLDPLVWIAILILATLRSPFLPSYGAFPSLWLAAVIAGVAWTRRSMRLAAVAAWVVLAVSFGQGYLASPLNAVLTFTHTIAALVVVFAILPRLAVAPAPIRAPGDAAPVPA